MAWHSRANKRKKTGGRKKHYRAKRLRELGSHPVETILGDTERKITKRRSRIRKTRLIAGKYVNVSDPSNGLTERLEILDVIENPANVDYNRRGVITKGTIVRTEKGIAKIVSRPGQDGVLDAVVYEDI
jgi:small subunit ribosomal protein S8e